MTKAEFKEVDEALEVAEDYMASLRKRVNDPGTVLHKKATEKIAQMRKARALVKKELG